jgi:hypothetical protein
MRRIIGFAALSALLLGGCAVYAAPVPAPVGVPPTGVYVAPPPVVVAPAPYWWWGWHGRWHARWR